MSIRVVRIFHYSMFIRADWAQNLLIWPFIVEFLSPESDHDEASN
jgi:hypothetical protein